MQSDKITAIHHFFPHGTTALAAHTSRTFKLKRRGSQTGGRRDGKMSPRGREMIKVGKSVIGQSGSA